jgi:glycosyltransferase involved in cell wall biosynthesis
MYGSDKVLLLLAQGLRLNGQFHPVVVLPGTGPLHDALAASGVEVHLGEVAKISRAMFTPRGFFRLVWQTVQAIRNLDRVVGGRPIAVVHSNTLAVLSGAVWAFLRRKKHLWHVHEIIVSPKLVSKAFPRLVNRLSDRVMSNSSLTERWLLSEQPALAARSVVVSNGLPVVAKPSTRAIQAFRESIGAADSDVVLTLAGRINRMKGQALLLEAMTLLKHRNRAASLRVVIVGGPAPGLEDLPARLKAQSVSAGLADQCSFIPFVDDIWPVWFGTDIAVVPSTEPESFGMVAIEAMAAGVPVIAANHGGVLDILLHEQTGLLFPPRDALALADAIERLASDEPLRRRLGAAGATRQREFFSVERQVECTAKVYEGMIR